MASRLKVAFVVATKDRPEELGRLWRSLLLQRRPPDKVVVVDASAHPAPPAARGASPPVLRYLPSAIASLTRQRNIGIDAVGAEADLIGFLDDDAVLEEDAVEEMVRFFDASGPKLGGAAFNMVNHPSMDLPKIKRTPFAETLGLYARRGGAVTASGFQTMIGPIRETVWTDWLPNGASIWRREVFRGHRFDEWYSGYGYLEDLDFSYRIGRAYRLAVVAAARYRHLPADGGRPTGYSFGVREVLNRLHFVKKYDELSSLKCRAALAARLVMSLALAVREREASFIARAFGNAVGLAISVFRT